MGGKTETITKGERSVHEEKNEKREETRGGFICDISTSSASCLNCAGLSKSNHIRRAKRYGLRMSSGILRTVQYD